MVSKSSMNWENQRGSSNVIDRLKPGDEVEFTIVSEQGSIDVSGTVRERAFEYVRIIVESPADHPDVTLVGNTEYSPALEVHQDYSWDFLGVAPFVDVSSDDFKAVIHPK